MSLGRYEKKLKNTLCYLGLLYVIFGILGPLEIYSGNQYDFSFGFNDFFWMFLLIYGGIWIVGSVLIALLPVRINNIVNIIIFITGIECYLQNMFFNKVLISPDGSKMNWASIKNYTILNTCEWIIVAIVLLVICLILKDKWEKLSKAVTFFLCIIQLVASISIIISVPKDRSYANECKIDATNQFAVGAKENIIVFVLDKYANDQFDINLDENPGMRTVLKDFTYYDNANSMYEGTGYALTLMLAGQETKTDDVREEFWEKESVQAFYDRLHNNGYQCFISSRDSNNVFGNMNVLVGKYDNVKVLDAELDRGLLFRLMTKMTIYKNAPYAAKPRFEVSTYSFGQVILPENYRESYYLNPEFYSALCEQGFYIDENVDKLFKVQHIQGMHGDYNMNVNAIAIPEADGTVEQSRNGLNVIISEYINQLKQLGVYESSTIIILADHGDASHEFGLQPTVLIKRSNEEHDSLVTNHAPISHLDFIPTILYYLGEDYSEYGTSIYDWNEDDRRERKIVIDDKEYIYYEKSELEDCPY